VIKRLEHSCRCMCAEQDCLTIYHICRIKCCFEREALQIRKLAEIWGVASFRLYRPVNDVKLAILLHFKRVHHRVDGLISAGGIYRHRRPESEAQVWWYPCRTRQLV